MGLGALETFSRGIGDGRYISVMRAGSAPNRVSSSYLMIFKSLQTCSFFEVFHGGGRIHLHRARRLHAQARQDIILAGQMSLSKDCIQLLFGSRLDDL